METRRLQQIEKHVLSFFQKHKRTHILAKELFGGTNEFANADLGLTLVALDNDPAPMPHPSKSATRGV